MEAFRRLYDDLIGRSGLQMRGMINEADSREIKKGAKNTLFENTSKKRVEIIKVFEKTVKSRQKPSNRSGGGYPTFHEKVEKTKKSQNSPQTAASRRKPTLPGRGWNTQLCPKKPKKVKIWPNWAKKGSNPRKRPIRAKKRPIREKKGARAKKWENSGKKVAEKNV